MVANQIEIRSALPTDQEWDYANNGSIFEFPLLANPRAVYLPAVQR